jgi:hypothetical protein
MTPLPRVRQDEPLEPGQTTICNTLNGSLGLHRPNPPPRPRRVLKPSGQSNTILGRRLVGGENEKYVVKLFVTVCLAQEDNREPGDNEDINNENI